MNNNNKQQDIIDEDKVIQQLIDFCNSPEFYELLVFLAKENDVYTNPKYKEFEIDTSYKYQENQD